MLILKGRLWKDGPWRAELRDLRISVKADSAEVAMERFAQELDKLAPSLMFELEVQQENLVLTFDDVLGAAMFIIQRRAQ